MITAAEEEAVLGIEIDCTWAHIFLARERLRTIELLLNAAEIRRASHQIAGARAAAAEALKMVRGVVGALSQDT